MVEHTNEDTFLSRNMPADTKREKDLLGAILLDPTFFLDADQYLTVDDFFFEVNCLVFRCMKSLHEKKLLIDTHALLQEAQLITFRGKTAHDAGVTFSYLLSLQDESYGISREAFSSFIEIIKDKSYKRKIVYDLTKVIETALHDKDLSVDTMVELAQQNLSLIAHRQNMTSSMSAQQLMTHTFNHMIEKQTLGINAFFVPTGYKELDTIMTGFGKGHLVIIAGRPGTGKTMLALNFALNQLIMNRRVAFFSLEMLDRELGMRLLSMHSGVDHHKIRLSECDSSTFKALTDSAEFFVTARLQTIYFVSHILDLKSAIRTLYNEHKIEIVYIDYLDFIKSTRKHDFRAYEIGEITRELKTLAKELDIPIVLLAQTNRKAEDRERPRLSDLKDSGSIEQDADLVLTAYREVINNPACENPHNCEVLILKNRHGALGRINLYFNHEILRLDEYE